MSREFAKAVWVHYKTDGTDLKGIPSLAKQLAFVHNLRAEHASNVQEGMNNERDS